MPSMSPTPPAPLAVPRSAAQHGRQGAAAGRGGAERGGAGRGGETLGERGQTGPKGCQKRGGVRGQAGVEGPALPELQKLCVCCNFCCQFLLSDTRLELRG